MAVKYKYPNEEEVIISTGNDYEITQAKEIAPNSRYEVMGRYTNLSYPLEEQDRIFIGYNGRNLTSQVKEFKTYVKAFLFPNYIDTTTRNPDEAIAPLGSSWAATDDNYAVKDYGTYANYLERVNDPNEVFPANFARYNYTGHGFLHYTHLSYGSTRRWREEPTYVGINLEVLHLIPIDSRTKTTLKIFRDGVQIFVRSDYYIQPEYVEIFGKECPSNTCPVKCGENVCCYGSDGIATESFLFSESIY